MTATTIRVQMAQRKDTAANWTAANPILLSGEIGYETDTKKFKIGNGSTAWNSLAYLPIPDGSGNLTITGNLEIGSTGSLTFEGSTADGFETTLAVTNPTADRTITLPDVTGTVVTTGDTGSVTSTMIANGTIVDADISSTAEIAVSKLANGTANQVIVTDGTNVSWSDNLTLAGDLTVNGTTTTINTQDLLVEDKNIIIGNVATPSDVTADGGGITLKGATDKTINWVDATDAWTLSEHVNVASGKEYRIAGTKVLDATSLGSSVLITSANITDGTIVDGDISATAEIAVSKLADGTARQLLQTDSAGTGVEWASNIDIPGTLDVTGAATFDSSVAVTGTLTKSGNNVVTVGDTGTVTSTMILDGTIVDGDVNATAAIAGTKISPDFGSQNVTTTGTSTAASFIPTSSTVPTNGVYLPAANSVALATNGAGRLFIDANGYIGFGTSSFTSGAAGRQVVEINGSSSALINLDAGGSRRAYIYSDSTDTIFYNTQAGPLLFGTNDTERLRITSTGQLSHIGAGSSSSPAVAFNGSAPSNSLVIDSTGRVGLGTSSATERLTIGDGSIYLTNSTTSTSTVREIFNYINHPGTNVASSGGLSVGMRWSNVFPDRGSSIRFIQTGTSIGADASSEIALYTYNLGVDNGGERVRIDKQGRVGVGTTSPGSYSSAADNLVVAGSGDTGITIAAGSTSYSSIYFADGTTGSEPYRGIVGYNHTSDELVFYTAGLLRSTIDSAGRLLVGTSSARHNGLFQVETVGGSSRLHSFTNNGANANGPIVKLTKTRGSSNGAVTAVQNGDELGYIAFSGTDGTNVLDGAYIFSQVDGTPGANDLPSRLVFSVTADGAASPTEALRISSNRAITVSDGGNVVLGTTTGTKIGTATTQKLGFYNATPVVQPAAVADATDAASVITQLNDLLSKLRTLGIIAT